MSLQIPGVQGASSVSVSDAVFGQPFNETLVHQLVVKYMATARSGTKAQKNRSDVSGGGLKPWRQKGTGRARSGTTRGPIWRSGGVTFAARPRSYDQKLNKKMYAVGLRSIYSELLRQERLSIVENLIIESAKTRVFVQKIKSFGEGRLLLIVDDISENLVLSARNLPYVAIATPSSVDPVSLVSADNVVVSSAALKQIEERLT